MFKKNLFIGFGLIISGFAYGQTIQNYVIGSAGKTFSESDLNLDFTIGEAVIQQFDSGEVLHQGFHQVNINLIVTSVKTPPWAYEVNVFPNPSSGIVHIETSEDLTEWTFMCIDVLGRVLATNDANQNSIDISTYNDGIYFILLLKDSQMASYQIVKSSK